MANIKSQIKRNKANEKRHERNKSVKTGLKSAVRKFRRPRTPATRNAAVTLGREASKKLDKAASKGVIPQEPGREPQVPRSPKTASL